MVDGKNPIYAKRDLVLMIAIKNIIRLETIFIILKNKDIKKNLRYKIRKDSTYDYHFINKEQAEEFE